MQRDGNVIVEWAPFELAEGVSEEALLAASDALQAGFLAKQPGFLRRELLRRCGRQWVDLVYWRDRTSVEAAMQAAGSSAACHAYFELMAGAEHAAPAAGVLLLEQADSYA